MGTNNQNQFDTIEDILNYAITEEKDAYFFYKNSADKMTDPDLKKFLLGLAKMEMEHYNILKKKLEKCNANSFCHHGILSSFHEDE